MAGAVREVLERSPQPLTVAKLRSALNGPFKVPPKLKDAFVALIDAEIAAGWLYAWPGGKYWTRDLRAWAEPAMLAAAAKSPVLASKVVGAVSKLYGKKPAEALLAELVESGALLRVPLFGGAKAKLCSRVLDEAAFRAELDAAFKILESGYKRVGQALACRAASAGPPPDSREGGLKSADDLKPIPQDAVLNAIAELEPRKGLLVTAPRMYRALPNAAKADIDAALIALQDDRRVILHRHSNPQSANPAELIDGLYVGACWRVNE